MAKQKFKITNWPDHNKALRQRGSLAVWIDELAIAAWTDSAQPEHRGRPLHYTDMAITTETGLFIIRVKCWHRRDNSGGKRAH